MNDRAKYWHLRLLKAIFAQQTDAAAFANRAYAYLYLEATNGLSTRLGETVVEYLWKTSGMSWTLHIPLIDSPIRWRLTAWAETPDGPYPETVDGFTHELEELRLAQTELQQRQGTMVESVLDSPEVWNVTPVGLIRASSGWPGKEEDKMNSGEELKSRVLDELIPDSVLRTADNYQSDPSAEPKAEENPKAFEVWVADKDNPMPQMPQFEGTFEECTAEAERLTQELGLTPVADSTVIGRHWRGPQGIAVWIE